MDYSTSDWQLNQSEVDFETESNEVPETFCGVDDQFVPKIGMTFNTFEDATKFYMDYSKVAYFSTRVRSTNKKENKIKNQLITCSREGKWKSKISPTEKTNPSTGLNFPDIGVWIISKVVLHHLHSYCPDQAQMLKQHMKLSISVHRTIENNEEASIRPSKTFQSFVAAARGHRELNFIEKDVKNYTTREVCNTGMRSTQRSEIMHSFFNKFITRNSSLIQFVKQYDNCLGSREQTERESDAADFHTVIPCAIKSSTEVQFQHVYTHQKFRKVQVQFRGKVN
ncbi:hypothetical protein Ahy_B03g067208 [Arachis hypogaea]|uniref:Uncharacterized protein n=1 Tax=Arachis hypogaea TaxID=3818 RepID=A0A445A633_ARAHY|nr:hypothetical protein Ahy_B03g067208 [Arachis hypogaea]